MTKSNIKEMLKVYENKYNRIEPKIDLGESGVSIDSMARHWRKHRVNMWAIKMKGRKILQQQK